jgi:adenylosuccinate lyase
MASVWTLENQYASWLKVELAVVAAQSEAGAIPAGDAGEIIEKASFDPARIAAIEAEVNHDVVAFATNVEETVGRPARWFHYGLTSSDVLDTSLSLRLLESAAILREDLVSLVGALLARAEETIELPIMGRSHGIHAEPTTMGLKFASFFSEFARHLKKLDIETESLRVGKISGPVGNFSAASLSPEIEEKALARLSLKPVPVASQIIPRDIHAGFFQFLALVASSVERLAVEVRHLSRTEVGEVSEAFGEKQKGSSAMPHKKNPIVSENLTGLARLVRAYAQAILEDVVLWHERDISHSSVERVAVPDALTALDFMLARAVSLVAGLVIRGDRMRKNMELAGGLHNSQEIMLTLIKKGLTRVEAYALVRKEALSSIDGRGDFKTLVEKSPEIAKLLSPAEIGAVFEPDRFVARAKVILERAKARAKSDGVL